MLTEDQQALVSEIVPRTLRSLFVLRITLYVTAGVLGLIKFVLTPPWSDLVVYFASGPNVDPAALNNLIHALNLLFSGLLASVLALVIATYFIQARIRGHADEEATTNQLSEAAQP